MMGGGNIFYDIDGRQQVICYGGIGNIHQLAASTGLIDAINTPIDLFKRHLPYHESDNILNIAYNFLACGNCVQDIELLRNDDAWFIALGAQIIPAPATAGDFFRRFNEEQIGEFMEVKNPVRGNIWQKQSGLFGREAIINADGIICATDGECKQGMDISYNGQWGYHTLVNSMHNTREHLYSHSVCLIIKTGRRICYRLVDYSDKLKHVIKFSETIKAFGVT